MKAAPTNKEDIANMRRKSGFLRRGGPKTVEPSSSSTS
jgi:hypothetical protein